MAGDQSSELYLQIAQDKLNRQDESIRLLTTKAGILFAACVLFVNGMEAINIIPISLIITAACLALFVVWAKNYGHGPRISRTKEILDNHEYEDSVNWIAQACHQCARNNAPKIAWSGHALNVGMILLGLGVLLEFIC